MCSENGNSDDIQSEKNKRNRAMRLQLINVYDGFYKKWIKQCMLNNEPFCDSLWLQQLTSNEIDVDSVSVHNLIEEAQSEYLRSAFNAVYDEMVEKLQLNLDENHLALQREQFIFGNTKSKINGKQSAVFTEIALKWNATEFGIKQNESMIKCTDLNDCRSMKRIEFVMDLFDRYILNRYFCDENDWIKTGDIDYIEIVMQCLSDYDGIALLNDFDHIRGHNESIDQQIECEHNDVDGGECIGGMMRKYRDSERRENDDDNESDDIPNGFKQYVDGPSLRERHLLETSIKIHSFLCHEEHDENDDEKEVDALKLKANKFQSDSRTAELSSKFVNEVQSEEKLKKVDGKRMEDLAVSLRANGFPDDECNRLMEMLLAQHYDSETIIDDLVDEENDAFNLYPQSNLFPMLRHNLFLAKITKKHFGAKRNDEDSLPPFTFGMSRLFHWKHFEDRLGFVVPKYRSLKEECLQNSIHSMSMELFAGILFNAFMYQQSTRGRGFRASDLIDPNKQYEIPPNSPLSVSHIFVLLMYCNLTDLQYKYKRFGCRERDNEQSLEELKKSNSEIAHWHRFLIETVFFFGDIVIPKQVFFTGINVKLSFQTFTPLFNAPFSTTTSLNVATKFCGDDGVICTLIPAPGSRDRYFNVEWLSDFAHEKERLFVGANNMRISDIHYFEGQHIQRSEQYLKAFLLFSSLFNGHFVSPILRERNKKKQLKPWRLLIDLIRVYKASNGITETSEKALNIKIPLFIQQLFYQLLDGFKTDDEMKVIIESDFNLLDDSLRNELVVSQPQNAEEVDGGKVRLSPFMRRLCDEDSIAVMEKYVWAIDDEQLNKLRNANTKTIIFSEEFCFVVPGTGTRMTFVLKFGCKFESSTLTAIGIDIKDIPFPLDGRWSVIVDEVEYARNDLRFFGKGAGSADFRFAFEECAIDGVDVLTVTVALYLTSYQ